jgi:hypothetical protein
MLTLIPSMLIVIPSMLNVIPSMLNVIPGEDPGSIPSDPKKPHLYKK